MRILLSGAQGVGKSTLNKSLLEILPGYISLDSISAKFLKSKDDLKNPEKLRTFQTVVSLYCFSKYLSLDNFISSRSLADAYAYSKYEYLRTLDPRYKIMMDLSLDLVRDFNKPDVVNIFIPKMFELKSGNFRSSNIKFQDEIDRLMLEFHQISGLNYYTIKSDNINDRVDEVKDIIGVKK